MRFRSGTLERSIKRWGPKMPRGKLQRVQFSWKYITLENTSIPPGAATFPDIVMFNAVDWQVGSVATGCRNVAFDLCVGVAWTPENNVANIFHNASIRWGVFCIDTDDAPATLDDAFATTRALRWGMLGNNFHGMNLATPVYPQENAVRWNFRVRFKQRYVKFDEEVRFMIQPSTDISDAVDDMRLHLFGRVSWETP